jgi:hypothetical protein
MPDQPPWWSSFFASVHGKVIGALVVVSLLLGVAIEIVTLQKLTYERDSAYAEAQAKNTLAPIWPTEPRKPGPNPANSDSERRHTPWFFPNNPLLEGIAFIGMAVAFFLLVGLVSYNERLYGPAIFILVIYIFALLRSVPADDVTGYTVALVVSALAAGLGRLIGRYFLRRAPQ